MLAVTSKRTEPNLGSEDRMQGSKPVSVLLIIIGFAAMLSVMWMTGKFGWSLQDAEGDRIASATIHVLVDAAAAGLITASGIMLSWGGARWRAMGIGALLCALLLVAYSILSVYGFMSTRIAHLEAHKSIVASRQSDLDWKRSTSVSRDVPKAERLYLRQEARTARVDLEKSLSFVPDAAAASIASVFSTTTERVQRSLVMIGSCAGQLIKVSCLFIGFSMWPHRLRASQPFNGGDDGGSGSGKPKDEAKPSPKPRATVAAVSSIAARTATVAPLVAAPNNIVPMKISVSGPADALRDLQELLARKGYAPSQQALAARWQLSKSRVSHLLSDWERAGKVQRVRKGLVNEIVRPMGVGGSRYASAAG